MNKTFWTGAIRNSFPETAGNKTLTQLLLQVTPEQSSKSNKSVLKHSWLWWITHGAYTVCCKIAAQHLTISFLWPEYKKKKKKCVLKLLTNGSILWGGVINNIVFVSSWNNCRQHRHKAGWQLTTFTSHSRSKSDLSGTGRWISSRTVDQMWFSPFNLHVGATFNHTQPPHD